jgi:hypothetical protein
MFLSRNSCVIARFPPAEREFRGCFLKLPRSPVGGGSERGKVPSGGNFPRFLGNFVVPEADHFSLITVTASQGTPPRRGRKGGMELSPSCGNVILRGFPRSGSTEVVQNV